MVERPGKEGPGLLEQLEATLQARREKGLLREIKGFQAKREWVDFSSNDYLGFAQSQDLEKAIEAEMKRLKSVEPQRVLGSTGSRLLTGDNPYYQQVEAFVGSFYQGESGLLFNSGYDLNLGLFACVPQPGDVILFDELMHNSVREGLKLSRASSRAFRHNDCDDLQRQCEELLSEGSPFNGNIIVSVESVYSMDGHCAPLERLCQVCEKYGASLIVDEAHGVGVFGPEGRGLVAELGLSNRVFCRVCTFGKAPGVHGAALIGPKTLREYMANYCRPLIYSTSLPTHSLAAIKCSHELLLAQGAQRQRDLHKLVQVFKDGLAATQSLAERSLTSPSAIQGVILPGNEQVSRACAQLQHRGFRVMPIRSPTVPKGSERIRIILHCHNSPEQVSDLVRALGACCENDDACC